MPYPWETPPPVYEYVGEAHTTFMAKGDELSQQAQTYAAQLAQFNNYLRPTVVASGFNFQGELAGFNRPSLPDIQLDGFNVVAPAPLQAPAGFTPGTVNPLVIPDFTETAPVLATHTPPAELNIVAPTAPPRPIMPSLPVEPDFMALSPAPVTLEQLNIPAIAAVELPLFTAARPEFNPTNLDQNGWQFSPEVYVSALLDKVKARVSTWMDGQEALPAAIERALYDRGRARVEVELDENVERIWDEFGSRGFSAPPGMLTARVDDAIFKAGTQKAEFNTAATMKSFDEALANMRLALSSGIQLEGVTINLHVEMQRLVLASAQNLRDTGIALLNAEVSVFNALVSAYQADAQVYETKLRAALSVLEEARLRIEAEKLKGDINEQSVRVYVAAWEGVRTAAQVYDTRVNAIKTQVEILKAPIEIFAEETRAFETQWSAQGKRWDGYRAAIEADGSKTQNFRALTEAYLARVQGAVAAGGHDLKAEELRIQQNGQNIALFDASMKGVMAALEAEKVRLSALGQKVDAQATMYRAQADVETAASAATDRTFQLGLERAKAESDASLETARIRSQENVQFLNLLLEAQKTLAQVFSQLASSTMSAMNYSASLSGGISSSYSLSESRELD